VQHNLTEKEGTSKTLQETIERLERNVETERETIKKLEAKMDRLSGDVQTRDEAATELKERYKDLKQRLADESVERAELQEELKMANDEKKDLYDEINEMETRVLNLQDVQKAYEKEKRDTKRSSSLQSDLMAQRGRAEKAEAQIASLRRTNKELAVRIETHSNSVDLSRDQTLQMLIEARLNYASAQEELDMWRGGRMRKNTDTANNSFERKNTSKK